MLYSAASLRQASFCVELVLKDMESLTSTMIVIWTIQTFCRLKINFVKPPIRPKTQRRAAGNPSPFPSCRAPGLRVPRSARCVFCSFPCGGRLLTFIGPSCPRRPLQRHLGLAGNHQPPRLGHAQARTDCLWLSLRRGWF